jgi:hypothetical protein
MLSFVLTVFIVIFFVIADLVPVYKGKQYGTLCIYLAMMVSVVVISFLLAIDIKVPSPAVPLKQLVDLIWGTGK